VKRGSATLIERGNALGEKAHEVSLAETGNSKTNL